MIDVLFFRSSSISNWSYCQAQYFITYNLGYQSPSGAKAIWGTITHKTLEIFAVMKKSIQDNSKKKKITINDEEVGDFTFKVSDLLSEELYKEVLDRSYNHYKVNSPHIEWNDKKDYKFCKDMVDNCFGYNEGMYDPRKSKIFMPEKNFTLSLEDQEWAHFEHEGEKVVLGIKGTMDLLVEIDHETLMLEDYKSGRRLDWATGEVKTEEKLQNDMQLLLYLYAIKRLFPEYKYVIVTIIYLRDGGPFSLCFDTSDIDKFMERLKKLFFEIRACNFPKPINKWRSDFRCTRLCHYHKTNWPGTEVSMCQHVENYIKTYGITKASKDLKREGHTMLHYQSPGMT